MDMDMDAMNHQYLLQKKHWIFDMDGTLTHALHDFDQIRRQLGLPEGKPILEQLAELPQRKAQQLHQRLDMIELNIARQSRAAPGVVALLNYLQRHHHRLGIVTRNNLFNIHATLDAAGLSGYFQQDALISRHCTAPKPSPAGILRLLDLWQGEAAEAVMVGDHRFDLDTGRAAGTTVVYVDSTGEFPYRERADVCVRSLEGLCPD